MTHFRAYLEISAYGRFIAPILILLVGITGTDAQAAEEANGPADDRCFEAIRDETANAQTLCSASAAAGNALDQYNLGLLLLRSANAQEQRDGGMWLERAAAQLPVARYAWATWLLHNNRINAGTEQMRLAAEANVVDAQFDYATLLLEQVQAGSVTASSDENPLQATLTEARRWYARASQNGDLSARFNLAMLLLNDNWPGYDPAQGLALLYTLGSMPEHSNMTDRINKIEQALPPDIISNAKALLPQLLVEFPNPATPNS